MKKQWRILIADDHAILRDGIRAVLERETDFEVVGEAENGRDALRATGSLSPDLLLTDLSMPDTNGTDVLHQIKRRFPNTKAVVLTMHKTDEYIHAALKAGADGYVLKGDSQNELILALRKVLDGKTYLSPSICGSVVGSYLGGQKTQHSTPSWAVLTDREREVIKLIAEGYRNKDIAEYLSLSLKTVEKHRSNLMKKLDLHNTAALTAYAIENGLTAR